MRMGIVGWTKGLKSRVAAMTLPEVMVTAGIFSLVMAGFITLHVFSIKMNRITAVKLGASDQAREILSLLFKQIREAADVRVGYGTATSFVEPTPGQLFQGNAIMIYPVKTNTNIWIRYYLETNAGCLKSVAHNRVQPIVHVEGITNHIVFRVEDFRGTVLTNASDRRVIGVTLQFYKLVFPSAVFREGGLYDFYQVRTRIGRRPIE